MRHGMRKSGDTNRLWVVRIALLSLALFVSSCGYHFTSVGGIVPEGAKTVAIPVFINATSEPYLDVEVTKAVVDEFLADGRLKVVGVEAADLVLKGRVTRFDMTPASYSVDSYVQSYNVSIGVSLTLEDAKTQKVLLQDPGIGSVFVSNYGVSLVTTNTSTVNISATKISRDAAIKNASKSLASSLRSRVLEGF
jgi:hypothetical protein